MADAKKCDRCGKYYDGGSHKLRIFDRYPTFDSPLDLCENCNAELEQWFNNPPDLYKNCNTELEPWVYSRDQSAPRDIKEVMND